MQYEFASAECGPQMVNGADVALNEFRVLWNVRWSPVGMDARLKRVEDPDVVAALQQQVNGVRADEASAARDQDSTQKFTITFAPSKSKLYGISRTPALVSAARTLAFVPSGQ